MGVELNRSLSGGNAVANSQDRRQSRAGGLATDGSSGFAKVMGSLTSEEDKEFDLDAEIPEAGKDAGCTPSPVADVGLMPEAPSLASNEVDAGLTALSQPQVPLSADGAPVDGSSATMGASLPGSAARLAGNRTKSGEAALVGGAVSPQSASTTSALGSMATGADAAGVALPEVAAPLQVNAWLAHRNALQAQALSVAEQDLKGQQGTGLAAPVAVAAEVAAAWMLGQGEALIRPTERFAAKSSLGSAGASGVDGGFAGAMVGTNRTDLTYEIPASSAVVADTAVAETVSYWASHGVQTAELALDGFGDSPVEVRIVLNGDQAQVDFRTDQAGVRQMLDTATAQLKEMLSNQGLQLAGVSVGTSGKGRDTGDDRRSRPNGFQSKQLVKTEAMGAVNARVLHPAVGRSLDLFV